jgi:hypothetical protein
MASASAAYVPVILEVSGKSLLAEHPADQMGVEIYAYVSDAKGEMRDFFSELVPLDLSGPRRKAFAETGLKYYGHLNLEAGEHLVRVLVRNATTGRTGVETVPLTVPQFGQADPVLLPPFFLEEGPRWVLVRGERVNNGQQTVVYPFTLKGEPYIPAARPALKRRDEAEICLVAYNLGEGDLEVSGRVLAVDGSEVDGGRLAFVERTATGISGLDKLLATFRPTDLGQGDYTLEVAVTDPSTRSVRTNTIPFTVRK